jgi:hypothetical protein
MANSWDDLMKMLVRSHPQDFVSFAGLVYEVETRFPDLASLAQQQAERINRPEMLSTVLDKLFLAQTTESARQVLMEIAKTTDAPS